MSDWIQTYSGRRFPPGEPRTELFDLGDIAHSLSLLCRFNGHCLRYYSVADHSVRVSRVCPPDHALWGLLHDLGEAYLGDLPRPIKAHFPLFVEFEDRLLRCAAEAFGLPWPMPPEVKQADDVLLATEFRDLMARTREPWPLRAEPLPQQIIPLTPEAAEAEFMARFREISECSPLSAGR